MKKIIIILAFVTYIQGFSQSTSKNYLMTTSPVVEVKDKAALNALIADQKRISITYFDGLSRAIQQIAYRQSPLQKDIVQINEYDLLGRESKSYLPYADIVTNLSFKNTAVADLTKFYNSRSRIARSNFPYAETVFNSASNRIVEQSSTGEDWQLQNGHTRKIKHEANKANEVRFWKWANGNATATSFYPANELYLEKNIDEHGNTTYTYKNKKGIVVLKKQQVDASNYTETYYIYNDLNQLVLVIPPQALSDMTSFNVNAEIADRVYKYIYDARERVIEKKIPHKGWEHMVYDTKDRIIMTQDALQRATNEWSFIKYDALNRIIQTGLTTGIGGRSSMQTAANNSAYQDEYRTSVNFINQHGYSNQAFPTSNLDILIINYYDDYDFNSDGVSDKNFILPPSGYTALYPAEDTHSLETGSKVKILDGTNTFLTSTNWYDKEGRIIQTQSDNHLGGYDRIHTEYNFVDEVLKTTLVHNDGGSNTITLNQRFTYDHAGRLKRTYHQVNQQNEILFSDNTYNELGQLVDKKLHATDLVNPTFLQSIDYSYNIRGWLTHINNADLNSDVYTINPYHPGQVLGFQISAIDFNITESESETEGRSLQLILEDQSQISVDGNVETSIYDYRDPVIITLMKYPEDESQISTYNDLKRLAGTRFQLNYEERPLSLTEETRLEEIQGTIESSISDQLIRHTENQMAISQTQTTVVSYISGLLKHTAKHDTPFSSKYLQFYFKEQGGQLFLNAYDANQGKSFEVFLMAKSAQNINTYNFLFGLTNDSSVFPPKSTPIIVDFGNANLYEGMGTKEAIKECLAYLTSITVGYNITHQRTLDQMELLAERFAIGAYPNTYFNNDSNDLWGMEIKYNSISKKLGSTILGNQALYNGNISEITWQGKGDEQKRGYGYTYDRLNRLEKATFKAYNSSINSWNLETNRYDVPQITYDLNGNILSLQRNGFTSGNIGQNPTFGLMDNLSYAYNGDQLMSVSDAGNVHHTNDFKDGNLNGNDYAYDINGNMTADYNKGIQTITYNHLNLPTLVDTGNGETITYVYDATGNKLSKIFNNYGSITRTEYTAVGNYTKIGNNSRVLDFIFTDEGRLVNDNGAYRYEYFYKDHLGNTRLAFSDQNNNQKIEVSEITQQQNYYPFGLEHKGTLYGVANQTTHKYLYNGKEFQDELGVNLYSMDFRQLDPAIGRWTSIDPLAEKYSHASSYASFNNNPVYFSDPSGLEGEPTTEKNTVIYSWVDEDNVTHIVQYTTTVVSTINEDGSATYSVTTSSVENTVRNSDGEVTEGNTVTTTQSFANKDSQGCVSTEVCKPTTSERSDKGYENLDIWTNHVSSYNKKNKTNYNKYQIDKTGTLTTIAGAVGTLPMSLWGGAMVKLPDWVAEGSAASGFGIPASASSAMTTAGAFLTKKVGSGNNYFIIYGVKQYYNGILFKQMRQPKK